MKTYALCGFLAVCAFVNGPAQAQEAGEKVYISGVKSTVMIEDSEGRGSGSVINMEGGFILTNWHVVGKSKEVRIIFPMWENDTLVVEGKRYEDQRRKIGLMARVIATNQQIDLALVKLKDPTKIPKGIAAVEFATKSPGAGARVYSIGNPRSQSMWVLSTGDVRAAANRQKWASSSDGKGSDVSFHNAMVIETTSPTNPGDSGGPCFNEKGEQVAVTQGYKTATRAFSTFIDCSEAKGFMKLKEVPYFEGGKMVGVLKENYEPERKTEVIMGPAGEQPAKADPTAEKARQEKAAAAELKVLRLKTSDPTRKDFAVNHLRSLIERFPDTAAAKEAEQILSKLQ
jgi:hypothetical protein